jgi:hypothetical protein
MTCVYDSLLGNYNFGGSSTELVDGARQYRVELTASRRQGELP